MSVEEVVKSYECDSGRIYVYLDYANEVTILKDHLDPPIVARYLKHYRDMFKSLFLELEPEPEKERGWKEIKPSK
mgnify:CR=1 FL=1